MNGDHALGRIHEFEGAQVLPEWTSVRHEGEWVDYTRVHNNVEALNRSLADRAVMRLDEPVFMGYNNSYGNYYHLLMEWAPAIWQFARRAPADAALALPVEHSDWPALWELITGLGIERRVLWVDNTWRGPVLQPRVLLYPFYLSGGCNDTYEGAAREVHEWLARRVTRRGGQPQTPRRVFVSRADSPKRVLVNEGEVKSALERQGFTTVHLSRLGFSAQVRLFMNAETVVSDHGAGLVNLVFHGREGRSTVEIRPETYPNPCFEAISAVLGEEHALVSSSLKGEDIGWHDSRYTVEVDAVLAAVL